MNDPLSRSILFSERAYTYATQGNLNEAIEYMDKAYDSVPRPDYRVQQAIWLFSAGLPEDGQRFLQLARETPPVSRWFPISNEKHIDRLTRSLEESFTTSAKTASPR
jgi:hypothetical protein